jgi:hypothetical protein
VGAAAVPAASWWHRRENRTGKSRPCQPDVDVDVGVMGAVDEEAMVEMAAAAEPG